MKYFSMFSGIGGFELGIQQAYENNVNRSKDTKEQGYSQKDDEKWKRLVTKERKEVSSKERPISECFTEFINKRPLCIGYSEIDKYAIQIYEKHFKHKNYGDTTTINTNELPDFDLLVGGFPCQAFSIAGKRKGFDDTRGTLFFEIARILRDKRPRYFLLENVKGLLSHEQGKTFQTILGVLTDLGYGVEWQVLNSKNFGVSQNRERVFIIGYIGGTSRPKVFPIGEIGRETNKQSRKSSKISETITARYHKMGNTDTYIAWDNYNKKFRKEIPTLTEPHHNSIRLIKLGQDGKNSQGQRIYDSEGISQTLAGNAGGQGGKTGLYTTEDSRPEIGQAKRRYGKEGIIPPLQNWSPLLNGKRIRRLTPTECERLQGFPDGWTEGVSDTQRYKCLGNAVTVNVIQAIMEKLI